ncbi:MAG TPA: Hsp20/alpha crystallin family protein [Terriglobales bacterium]|jgi:HSP20 family protein
MITRWDPIRELADLQKTVNAMFEDTAAGANSTGQSFVPPVNVYEDEGSIRLELEVPGLKPEDLDIRLENNKLTVRGERKLTEEKKAENYVRVERRYGSFVRSFTIPNTVSSENVQANYTDGVLEITLAKRPETQPKQIKVNLGTSTMNNASKQIEAEPVTK